MRINLHRLIQILIVFASVGAANATDYNGNWYAKVDHEVWKLEVELKKSFSGSIHYSGFLYQGGESTSSALTLWGDQVDAERINGKYKPFDSDDEPRKRFDVLLADGAIYLLLEHVGMGLPAKSAFELLGVKFTRDKPEESRDPALVGVWVMAAPSESADGLRRSFKAMQFTPDGIHCIAFYDVMDSDKPNVDKLPCEDDTLMYRWKADGRQFFTVWAKSSMSDWGEGSAYRAGRGGLMVEPSDGPHERYMLYRK